MRPETLILSRSKASLRYIDSPEHIQTSHELWIDEDTMTTRTLLHHLGQPTLAKQDYVHKIAY